MSILNVTAASLKLKCIIRMHGIFICNRTMYMYLVFYNRTMYKFVNKIINLRSRSKIQNPKICK